MTSAKQSRQVQSPNTYRQGLSSRLQQIVQLLYKNNGQFAKGLPSQHQFQEMLSHCFNCYDQLDFIILEYSRHSINYLQPKMVAQHMHRIMRVTKYLFSNLRHWVQSYSLDIVKKAWEEKSYFPTEAAHQVRCSSCNMYLQEMALKEAKHDIFGWQECRELFQEQLKQTKQEEESKKPLTAKETTEYVGSVNYLTRIIKEMEDSAHSYSKLTETIEKEQNHQDLALRFLEQLLSSMRRRIGEKCIYRLKKVIKNWEKSESQEHDGQCKKPAFKIKQIINQNYIPHANNSSELRKTVQTNVSASLLKKFKDQNHQLEVECNNLKASFIATKNNLTFLEKREEIQKREIERLTELLAEKGMERNTLANELRASRRGTIKPHTEPDQSLKLTVNVNAYAKQKLLTQTQKSKKYSKFKVKRMSRQSEAFSNDQDKTLYFTKDQNIRQNHRTHTEADHNDDSSYQEQMTQIRTAEVGCQWEDLYCSERQGKLKEKSIRNSKMTASNRQRTTIAKNNKAHQEQTEKKQPSIKKPTLKALDQNLKSKGNLKQDNRISYEDQNIIHRDNHTLNKLIESMQNKVSQQQLTSPKGSTDKFKVSMKVLDAEPSALKTSLQKINIYGKDSKIRELRPLLHENKAIIKELPEVDKDTRFTQQLKKIINCRMATQGNEVKKKALKTRNTLFRPQHLGFFGGVSESYAYERAPFTEEKTKDTEKNYIIVLKNYLVNLRNFKNHLYDNIVMFLKCPFSLIDKDQFETKIMGDKQLTSIISKFVLFHSHKCKSLNCEHLQSFNVLIGLPHFQ